MQIVDNAIYLHKKSGRKYQLICGAKQESTGSNMVVYRLLGSTTQKWVRPVCEFSEKFELLCSDDLLPREVCENDV